MGHLVTSWTPGRTGERQRESWGLEDKRVEGQWGGGKHRETEESGWHRVPGKPGRSQRTKGRVRRDLPGTGWEKERGKNRVGDLGKEERKERDFYMWEQRREEIRSEEKKGRGIKTQAEEQTERGPGAKN